MKTRLFPTYHFLTLILAISLNTLPSIGQAVELTARPRHPVAVQLSPGGEFLYTANRRSGTLSVLDLAAKQVVREIEIGEHLSCLVTSPVSGLLATDEARHELILIGGNGADLKIRQRLTVPAFPVSIALAPDGRAGTVASLWSRQLAFLEFDDQGIAKVVDVLDMPFAPRCQLYAKEGKRLIVADSFSGRLAIIDPVQRKLLHVREFPGHNIRGLGLSSNGQMLIVAHQMLNELAHTVRNDVHWGLLMSNDLRWLKLDSVLIEDADLYSGAHMHPLGHAGNATGDPSGLAVAANGSVVVALGGVQEIAVGSEDDFSLQRIGVGRRPSAIAISHNGKQAFITNTFADSVSIVDLENRVTLAEVTLGPPYKLALAERGEQLFFDASLSHDSWMSCNSCHTDGHTNGMLNDNFSDASFGAPKRVLSLLGRAETAPFAWNGSAKDLDVQIRNSISQTMQSDQEPKDDDVEAIKAFLATLQPPPSIDSARGRQDDAAIARGKQQFTALKCVNCHAPPFYTTPHTYQVNLTDKLGNDRFNPPSLLGVGQRGPYFHDNRSKELADVFRTFGHQLDRELEAKELADLLAFLRSL